MASWPATARLISRSRRNCCGSWHRSRHHSRLGHANWSLRKNRVMFCAMDDGNGWIREKAAASLNPSQVETTLLQLSEQWPACAEATVGSPANALPLVSVIEQFPLGEPALLHLLAVSSICATRLTQNPETLLWLAQPEVCLISRSRAEMLAEVHALTSDSGVDNNFAALRFWKGREMTRVA